MHKSIMFIALSATKPLVLHADVPAKKQPVRHALSVDSSAVQLKHFDAKSLSQYQADPDFNYHTNHIDAGTTLWDRFWYWLWHVIENLFGSSAPNTQQLAPFTKYIMLALVVGALLYVMIKYISKDLANIFNRESTSIALNSTETSENIHEINFDDQIERAIEQQNYKLAVRLLYLQTLKQLSDAQIIHWKAEKTNSAYLKELSNADQKQMFTTLTYQFEYIWYGDFPVSRQSFQNINTLFQEFKKLVA